MTQENGGHRPPFSVSVDGATVLMEFTCERCGRVLRVRSIPDVKVRVFLKGLLMAGLPNDLNITATCGECEHGQPQA